MVGDFVGLYFREVNNGCGGSESCVMWWLVVQWWNWFDVIGGYCCGLFLAFLGCDVSWLFLEF